MNGGPTNRVFLFSQQVPLQSHFVAIAIGESDTNQRHVGIVHRLENGQPAVLHLEWHFRLRNDHPAPEYFDLCVVTGLRPERQRSIAALCRRIWKKNERGGIPYAFSDPRSSFALQSGKFLVTPTQYGLTCASFVLAVFDVAGLPLIQYEQWPADRPGDREWQQRIISLLNGRAEPNHVEHIRQEIGCVRYRPEEVAAGAALMPPPASFADSVQLAQELLQQIDQIRRPVQSADPAT